MWGNLSAPPIPILPTFWNEAKERAILAPLSRQRTDRSGGFPFYQCITPFLTNQTMNPTRLLTLLVAAVVLACSSCQSGKVAYGNSYYFKAKPRPVAPVPELQASTAPASVSSRPLSRQEFIAMMPTVPSLHQDETRRAEPAASQKEVRQRHRAHRKAMRAELKRWYREAPASVKEQVKQQVEGFARIGIIVGAAGLVMLLVGLIAGGNGFLVALGGILLGIGVVFILIDIL